MPAATMPPALGQALWKSLHRFAESYPDQADDWAQRMASSYLFDFHDNLMRLAGNNCVCRGVFLKLLKVAPPDLTGRAGLSVWCVAVHEFVNLKLGKPRFRPEVKHRVLSASTWRAVFADKLPLPPGL
jgi:hypothetical protein